MKIIILILALLGITSCSKDVEPKQLTAGSVTYTIYEPKNGVMVFSLYSIHWCLVEGEDFQRFYKENGLTEYICGGPNIIKLTIDKPCGKICNINYIP